MRASVDAKLWCFFTGMMLPWFMSNLACPTGAWVRLDVQNFTSIATGGGGWECGPQNIKNFHFLVGRLPWPISIIVREFSTPNYPTLEFQISCDSRHRLRSYCWETAHLLIWPNFSVHPVGKTMRYIEQCFDGLDELYYHAKFAEVRTTRARCRCENMVDLL